MRIGECADLSLRLPRSTGPKPWAIHVPLGKLKTEPMAPWIPLSVNLSNAWHSFVPWIRCRRMDGSSPVHAPKKRGFVHCVILASGLPCPRPLLRNRSSSASSYLCHEMRRARCELSRADEIIRHTSPEMTMRYLDVALTDLQAGIPRARSQPRHLVSPAEDAFRPPSSWSR